MTLRDESGIIIAQISGEVDISNAQGIAATLTGLPNLAHGLVVNLHDVDYLDSTAIALLHELAARLRRRSQPLVVVCPPDCAPRGCSSSPRWTRRSRCWTSSAAVATLRAAD